MYTTPSDNEILLHAAASAFRTATALHAEAVPASMRVDQQDGSMRFDLGAGGSCTLPVMVRRVVDRFAAVTPIVELQHRLGQKVLLVTSYVSPDMAERLRSHDIPFIDTAGNVSLRLPSALLYVVGRRAPAGGVPQRRARTASPKQLAVLFALIANPGLLNAPYRSIANAAGVALSTVNLALDDLLKRSLVGAGDDGKRRFIDWARVVDEWATLYPLRLRPKLASKRFSATRPDWWQGIDLQRYDAVLGSEAAAEKLAHNLRAERITLYAGSATPRELILDARLKADPGGEVEIVQRFWPAGLALATEVAPTVGHPVLVYADLLETGESRNVEAARQIREQYLAYPP